MFSKNFDAARVDIASSECLEVEIVIEVPRGSLWRRRPGRNAWCSATEAPLPWGARPWPTAERQRSRRLPTRAVQDHAGRLLSC